jgi:5-methylcytosine-specific restriction endonuclease McrA
METKKERRNRLARERYTQNERTRERYQLKARAAIPERNEKRKVVLREKAKEDGYIFCGSRKYNINALILESYKQERIAIIRANTDAMFWKTSEGREYTAESVRLKACLRLKTLYHNMTPQEKKQSNASRKKQITLEKKREYAKKYHEKLKRNNPDEFYRRQRIASKKERQKPKNKAKENLRCRFRDGLKRYRKTKKNSLSNMIGCTWAFFASWLESKFTKKMKWQNYGSYWHVDHIQPLASFDYSNDEHMRRAWHYTNLRPLEAKENMRKSDKIIIHQPELMMAIF